MPTRWRVTVEVIEGGRPKVLATMTQESDRPSSSVTDDERDSICGIRDRAFRNLHQVELAGRRVSDTHSG